MEEAWETIKCQEAVRCSIDLFFIGIIFFRKSLKRSNILLSGFEILS
jgi:hypothetical protein